MEQRRLGTTGLYVSRIALGTMTWGRDTDEDDASSQLKTFVESGGTLVDTADVYTDGESERLLGRMLDSVVRRAGHHHRHQGGGDPRQRQPAP